MNRVDWTARGARRCAATRTRAWRQIHLAPGVMLAAIAEGESRIEGLPRRRGHARDRAHLQQMGVRIEAPRPGLRIVHG